LFCIFHRIQNSSQIVVSILWDQPASVGEGRNFSVSDIIVLFGGPFGG
jgi:hypothetical protein